MAQIGQLSGESECTSLVKLNTEGRLMAETVAVGILDEEGFGPVICYPCCEKEELGKRVTEMRKLGVRALSFQGEKTVNSARVLGKGSVGVVILAHTETDIVALKIRRTDADRAGMNHEAEMLQIANSVNVGPKLLGFSENLLMTEYIDGLVLPRWIETLEYEESVRTKICGVLRDILEQCWRLDRSGLDHGELSQASEHIIVDREAKTFILDFETASNGRRVSNVTSVCNYLFMSGKMTDLISQRIGRTSRAHALAALKEYKKNRVRENFDVILRACQV